MLLLLTLKEQDFYKKKKKFLPLFIVYSWKQNPSRNLSKVGTGTVINSYGSATVLGKHPDLLVGPPTATVFPTNDRKYKRS
jgi:hypothetical protein